ncbi:S-layer homology domain-containing protein [Flavonifractor sp. HCP28S3_F3]|uniref:S-layer homology domain-containing protein n=1 Tax=Flavonifractor sp. HCP28S3_F3 TaxID=3438939 RepID=UPI003F8AD0FB
MRNLKRALSLALAAMMLIGMMVVSAGAASKDFTDKDEIKHTEAVNTLVALNVIGGKEDGSYFDPTGTLTRAEMAKLVTYVLNGGVEPVLGTKVTPTYSDIKGHWAEAYIEYCTSMNIIVGDGTGKFNPEGTLTASQCAKMLLTAMNYKDDVFGFTGNSWEINVNREANAAGLYDELAGVSASDPISRDNAAQMVYNAIQSKTMKLSWSQDMTTGQITQNYTLTGSPLFVDKFGGNIFVGSFDGNSDTLGLKEGNIRVTGALTTDDTSAAGWTDKVATFPYDLDIAGVGENFKVIYKEGVGGTDGRPDSKDTIYGVYNAGTTDVLNVTSNDIKSASDYTTAGKIKVDGVEYSIAAPTAGDVLVVTDFGAVADVTAAGANETALIASAKTAFSALSAQKGDTVKFILNDDGKVVKAYVQTYKLGTVTAVNSEKVTISGLGSIKIADNEVYEGIAKNDVVVYSKLYKSAVADSYVVVTKAETVSGKVTGYKGTENVTVDGTAYKIYNKAAMPASVAGETGKTSFGSSDIGETFTLYLVNGYVGAAIQTSENATNYSLVIDKNAGTAGSTLNALKVVVLAADGTKTTLTVSDKGASPALGDIVTYTGSADNAKITVEAAYSSASSNSTTTGYDKTAKTFNGVVTAADAVLFRATDAAFGSITNASTYKAYSIRSMKDFDVSANAYTYVTNDDGMVVAVFIGSGDDINTNTSDAVIGIVTGDNGVVKFDDVAYNQYTVASNDKTYTVNIEDAASNDTLTKGNVVAFAPSSDDRYNNNTGFVVLSNASEYTDVVKTIDGTNYTTSTVYVKSYDESEKLLTYYTGKGVADGDGAYTNPTGVTTKAVADDVTIVYVNTKADTAGDQIGVGAFDAMTGYSNVIILVNSDGVISHIVVETSNEANVFG